jgi:hypothetical protein
MQVYHERNLPASWPHRDHDSGTLLSESRIAGMKEALSQQIGKKPAGGLP